MTSRQNRFALILALAIVYFCVHFWADVSAEPLQSPPNPTFTTAQLVKDFVTRTGDSNPTNIVQMGDYAYFTVQDGQKSTYGIGTSLWRVNSNSEQFEQVVSSSTLDHRPIFLVKATRSNGLFFFVNSISTYDLWQISDLDVPSQIAQFEGLRVPTGGEIPTPNVEAAVLDNTLVFKAGVTSSVWISDGTTQGTVQLNGVNYFPEKFHPYQSEWVFVARDNLYSTNGAIWKTDGTLQGSHLLVSNDFFASQAPGQFATVGNKLIFKASDAESGRELFFIDDLNPNPTLIKDINEGTVDSVNSTPLITINDVAYFWRTPILNETTVELWRTDGTSDGTTIVKQFPEEQLSSNAQFYPFGSQFLFEHPTATNIELWRSDGTSQGTVLLTTFPIDSQSINNHAITSDNFLYFIKSGSLFRTDGTVAGTLPIHNATSANGLIVADMRVLPDGLVFIKQPATLVPGDMSSLWHIDNTATTAIEIATFEINALSAPTLGISFGNKVLFSGTDPIHGKEPWLTDGTAENTKLQIDINQHNVNSALDNLTVVADKLFLVSADNGMETLFVSDGTPGETTMLLDPLRQVGAYQISNLHVVDEAIVFTTSSAESAVHLWRSDGTESGTINYTTIDMAGTTKTTKLVGNLLFIASEHSLYSTDGTSTGTRQLFHNNGTCIALNTLTVAEDILYFSADEEGSSSKIWQSDGTPENTKAVVDASTSHMMYRADGQLLFNADKQPAGSASWFGYELWATEGTNETTRLVQDINPGSADASISFLATYQERYTGIS